MPIKNKVHLKNKIIMKLRQMTWEWEPISQAEKESKVDKATHECALCGTYVYTGKSSKSHESLIEKYPDKTVIKGTLYKDHIEPVVPIGKTQQEMSYDELVDSIFCDRDNIQCLCKSCHDAKSKQENEERKKSS